ncbi:hypothetical protein GUJ93_ZPchr0004g39283 [Zizania palustris]|uniref:Uncharacterized protein n=1 Tax=Zizania palustris TaxID=103762 RepID=A0A8J5SMN0_ZIZPA|nr:hypothetical protein GUJ93_ZPchr0004g39283 [Zizania palustris]
MPLSTNLVKPLDTMPVESYGVPSTTTIMGLASCCIGLATSGHAEGNCTSTGYAYVSTVANRPTTIIAFVATVASHAEVGVASLVASAIIGTGKSTTLATTPRYAKSAPASLGKDDEILCDTCDVTAVIFALFEEEGKTSLPFLFSVTPKASLAVTAETNTPHDPTHFNN